jgi:hypothetical protein
MKNWNDRASGRVVYVEMTEAGDVAPGGLGVSI